MKVPLYIHLEVTTICTVGCSQCYANSTFKGSEMDYSLCKKIIDDAYKLGIPRILITGGEPLSYTHLLECIDYIISKGIIAVISTSGVGLKKELLEILEFKNHLIEFHVSLNGSKPTIHNLSRAKFFNSLGAIKLLKSHNFFCGINWVAREDNLNDFVNLTILARDNNVNCITILANKAREGIIDSKLSKENFMDLKRYIIESRKHLNVLVEPCFTELNTALNEINCFNSNCMASTIFFDILNDGSISPCRHSNIFENSLALKYSIEYIWENSKSLTSFRDNKCNIITCKK